MDRLLRIGMRWVDVGSDGVFDSVRTCLSVGPDGTWSQQNAMLAEISIVSDKCVPLRDWIANAHRYAWNEPLRMYITLPFIPLPKSFLLPNTTMQQ